MELGTLIALGCCAAVLFVPRALAASVFLFGALYCPMGAGLDLAGLNFAPGRLLAVAGLVRLGLRGEFPSLAKPDWAALTFGAIFVWSGLFHENPAQAIVLRCGYALDAVGSYFVFRGLVRSHDDLVRCFVSLLVLFIPVALEMLWESRTRNNLFSYLGGLDSEPNMRKGRIRAQGPFRHAILAGTVAAALLPIAVGLLWEKRRIAITGIVTVLVAIFACASSGPIITLGTGLGGVLLWRHRHRLKVIRWAAVALLGALHLLMTDPVWFLIAKVNIVGGSTGWHRSKLIDSAINHFDEWWFAGTDYTIHWIQTSHMGWSQNHADITNYYIKCGVIGGLPLMCAFIWLLKRCFAEVGLAVRTSAGKPHGRDFFYWCLGAWLFAHALSMISVSYYDQSLVLFYAIAGVVASVGKVVRAESAAQHVSVALSDGPELGKRPIPAR